MKRTTPISRHRGVTMIEVLISIIILLVGLLSLAGLQSRSQQAEMESYQRAQALILMQDMADRINANRMVATCYAITTTANGSPWLGYASSIVTPVCTAGTLDQQARAIADMTAWNSMLNGTAETSGGSNVGAMIGARGCVIQGLGSNEYTVAVAWQGMNATAAPTVNCGNDQYSNENLRRVVAVTIQIAALK
jgi:type IV pilus assembly protein PilV